MRIGHRCWLLAVLVAATACSGGEQKDAARPDSADSSAMGSMPGMAHTGGTANEGMLTEMRTHLQGMAGAGSDSLRRMMPMHRQMAANMLQQMGAEMRQMNMKGDTTWSALTDSVRQDLTSMPDVTAQELSDFMEAHRARLQRLMEQHGAMMGKAH
jgi:hypothetical protein